MITSAEELNNVDELAIDKWDAERVVLTYDADGHLHALSWLYASADQSLYGMVKRLGAVWNPAGGGWTFPDVEPQRVNSPPLGAFPFATKPSEPYVPRLPRNSATCRGEVHRAQQMLDTIVKRHPDWPVIGHPEKPFQPLAGIAVSRLKLSDVVHACLIPVPLPFTTSVAGTARIFRLTGKGKRRVGLLVGSADEIDIGIESMVKLGAVCNDTLKKKWSKIGATRSKLQIKVTGWAVQMTCNLLDPLHFVFAPPRKFKWEGAYPARQVPVPWNGTIHTTRKAWPLLKQQTFSLGQEFEGDDPDDEFVVPVGFDASRVAGWDSPAPNGHLLHDYQKVGAKYCASRGMRALIGDEMGVGKTVQAIAAAEACSAARVVVICPANARYVWDREIQGWGGRGAIQHVTSQLDTLDLAARWHIITYDLISARAQTWRFRDDEERRTFIDTFPNLAKEILRKDSTSQIALTKPLNKVPAFDAKRVVLWEKIMQRLRGELMEQILEAGPLLTILDEAHRVKNRDSKRTKAVQRIAAGDGQMLMLTGTPLRNNEHEAAVLLSLLDDEAAEALGHKENGYTIQDVKEFLSYFMIRRTKADVLPELPAKTRQRIDISNLDAGQMGVYAQALNSARTSFDKAVSSGKSVAEARQAMQGGIERARIALGVAKVLGGDVCDLVMDVVENKGCCVVFCAHREVSDNLMSQLVAGGMRVAVVDGRTAQNERASFVDDFQEARLDVFIGGINAAGEAITLTRADTVIFVELDWVPAALLQAEDRIHRVGQERNCQVIQLIARMPSRDNLDEMLADILGAKMARIGAVLDEDTDNIISGSRAQVYERLLIESVPLSSPGDVVPVQDFGVPESVAQEKLVPANPVVKKRRVVGRSYRR